MLPKIELQDVTVPNWFVIAMGIGTVFVGLICIIMLCKIIGLFFVNKKEREPEVKPAAPAKQEVIENRQEIIAAVTAVVAEEMGKDVSALRVVSFKKV